MLGETLSGWALPSHHDTMWLVRLHHAAAHTATPWDDARELHQALRSMERSGALVRVVPLHPPDESTGTRRAAAHRVLQAVAVAPRQRHPHDGFALIEVSHARHALALRRLLERDPLVESVSPVPVRHLFRDGGTKPVVSPLPPQRDWNLHRIGWHEARARQGFRDAANVVIGVLDTGVDPAHPALRGRVVRYVHRYRDVPDDAARRDIVGHGTHISGIMTARPPRGSSLHGMTAAQVHVWKVFRDEPILDPSGAIFMYPADPILLYRALQQCDRDRLDVINMSFGGASPPDPAEQAIYERLLARGTVLVSSMGNGRKAGSPTMYPAALPGIIAVGATDLNDVVAPFSSAGPHISLCAPGMSVWSTLPTYDGQVGYQVRRTASGRARRGAPMLRNSIYDAWPGTSVASPHVAASVALLLANHGKASPADIRQRLMETADRVPSMRGRGFDPDYGAGRLNLFRALRGRRERSTR